MEIEQHKHCIVCGRAIPPGKEICSRKCRDKYEAMMKRRKMLTSALYALMFIFIIMFLVNVR